MKDLLFAKQKADDSAKADYRRSEVENFKRLATTEPVIADLLDEKEGPTRLKAVANYLTSKGVPADRLGDISAVEMEIARKAFLYDQAQEALKTSGKAPGANSQQPSPKGSAPMRSAARPAASPTPAPLKQAWGRLSQSGSTDDAVAVLNAIQAKRPKRK